jgi:hypothetical protein
MIPMGLLMTDALKKSNMVSTAEKYALEIEIITMSRGFQAQILRSCAQKRRIQQSYAGSLEGPTFSTQSAVYCQWREGENEPKPSVRTGRNRLIDSW